MKLLAILLILALASTASAQEASRDELLDQRDELEQIDALAAQGERACDRGIARSGELGERLSRTAATVDDVSGKVADWKQRSNFDPMLLVYAALGLTGVGGGAVLIRKVLKGPQAILAALAESQAQQPGSVPPGPPFRGYADHAEEAGPHPHSGGQVRGPRTRGSNGANADGRVTHTDYTPAGANGSNGGNGLTPADKLEQARTAAAIAEAQAQNPRSSRG